MAFFLDGFLFIISTHMMCWLITVPTHFRNCANIVHLFFLSLSLSPHDVSVINKRTYLITHCCTQHFDYCSSLFMWCRVLRTFSSLIILTIDNSVLGCTRFCAHLQWGDSKLTPKLYTSSGSANSNSNSNTSDAMECGWTSMQLKSLKLRMEINDNCFNIDMLCRPLKLFSFFHSGIDRGIVNIGIPIRVLL